MEFSREEVVKLKLRYLQALSDGKDSFISKGQEFDVGYAKYLIKYLEEKFNANI